MEYNNETQSAAFKSALINVPKQSASSLNSDTQQAGFSELGNQAAGLRRINIASMMTGIAQTAAFLSKLEIAKRNEPVILALDSDLLTKNVWDRLLLIREEYNGKSRLEVEIPECIISVIRERQIVKTFLKGKEGSHKQFLQNGDFVVTVIGKFVKKGHTYPIDKLNALNDILSSDTALDYKCRFLYEGFGFKKVVCDGRPKFFQISGVENEYGFEFTLVSD